MDQCLDHACRIAGSGRAVDDGLRRALARALIEGTTLGLEARDELIGFALRTLPEFRDREPDLSSLPLEA